MVGGGLQRVFEMLRRLFAGQQVDDAGVTLVAQGAGGRKHGLLVARLAKRFMPAAAELLVAFVVAIAQVYLGEVIPDFVEMFKAEAGHTLQDIIVRFISGVLTATGILRGPDMNAGNQMTVAKGPLAAIVATCFNGGIAVPDLPLKPGTQGGSSGGESPGVAVIETMLVKLYHCQGIGLGQQYIAIDVAVADFQVAGLLIGFTGSVHSVLIDMVTANFIVWAGWRLLYNAGPHHSLVVAGRQLPDSRLAEDFILP